MTNVKRISARVVFGYAQAVLWALVVVAIVLVSAIGLVNDRYHLLNPSAYQTLGHVLIGSSWGFVLWQMICAASRKAALAIRLTESTGADHPDGSAAVKIGDLRRSMERLAAATKPFTKQPLSAEVNVSVDEGTFKDGISPSGEMTKQIIAKRGLVASNRWREVLDSALEYGYGKHAIAAADDVVIAEEARGAFDPDVPTS